MRRVDLDQIIAGLIRPDGCLLKLADSLLDIVFRHGSWCRVSFCVGNCRRRFNIHAFSFAFSPCMIELDAHFSAVIMDGFNNGSQSGDMFIVPDAQVCGGDPAFRRNGCCLLHDQSYASHSSCGIMQNMPIRDYASFRRAVHAHRRHDDAVLKL